MPLVSTRVDVTDNFDNFDKIVAEVNAQARRAVDAAAIAGAQAARAVASQRSQTGRMAAIQVEPSRGTVDGWVASFVSPVHYAWFQNYGTLGERRKPLKTGRGNKRNYTRAPGTGIEPLGFLEEGKRAGRRALLRELARGI